MGHKATFMIEPEGGCKPCACSPKRIYKSLRSLSVCALAAASLSLFSSCDNISLDDRFIPIEIEHSEKVVLLEDFTGVQCTNCPDAAAVIENLHNTYGENFIAVGLHPTGTHFTEPIIPRYDLRSEAATAVYDRYKPTVFPTAMVDRTAFDGTVLQENRSTWGARVVEQMKQQTSIDLNLHVLHFIGDTENFDVQYDIRVTDAISDELYLQLWIIENNIVAPQLTATGKDMKYVHNHVLRAAINGNWGELLTIPSGQSAWKPGDTAQGSYSFSPNEKWNVENLQVVGFVYRKSDGAVLQAHLCNVTTQDPE